MDGLYRKAAQANFPLRGYLNQLCRAQKPVLFQLVLNQANGEPRGIDGQVYLFQKVRQRADVVLVAMRNQHALDVLFVFHHIAEIRYYKVDAIHVAVWKDDAAVHQNHVALALIQRGVFAHFPQAAQGDNLHRHSAFPAGRGPAPLGIAARHAPARGRLHRRGHGCICHLACPLCRFRPLCAARSGGRLALLVWARAALGRLAHRGRGLACRGIFQFFIHIFPPCSAPCAPYAPPAFAPRAQNGGARKTCLQKKTRSGPAWLPCAVASAGPAMRPGCCKLMYCFVSCP